MDHDLCVAVFSSVQRARTSLDQLIDSHPDFVLCLPDCTLFLRSGEERVETGILKLDPHGRVQNVPKGQLDLNVLRSFLPKNANWKVIHSEDSRHYPIESLTRDFASYLNLIVMLQTCSLFFVPRDTGQRDQFEAFIAGDSKAVIRTTLAPEDLVTLRSSMTKARLALGSSPSP